MAGLSRNQKLFAQAYAETLGISPAVAAGQLVAEEPPGASHPVGHRDQNWLNIGNTDSKWYGGAWANKSPQEAGRLSALWTQGKYSVPGFGRAAPGIVAFSRTGGQPLAAQVRALQRSGWASSGYPNLSGLVSQFGGQVKTLANAAPAGMVSSAPKITETGGDNGQGLAALLGQLDQRPQPVVQSSPLQAPSFSAGPVSAGPTLPKGYQSTNTSSAPVQDQASSLSALLAQASQLQGPTANVTAGASSPAGGSPGVSAGKVIVAPGADRGGVPTSKTVRGFLGLVAGSVGHPITITTGSNHNQYTVNGNVSDHWSGKAADIAVPIDSTQGDMIAGRALLLAGVPREQARRDAQQGGLYTLHPTSGPLKGRRVQVIWRTNEGGDHHNHVHVGIQ